MDDLQGRTAVITGGASGIGLALAGRAVREGMNVVLADIEEAALDRALVELGPGAARVVGVRTDVSRRSDVQALADAAFGEFGRVDLLCNNAGVTARARTWELTVDDWEWVLGVDLWGVVHGIGCFVPRMLEQPGGGHILNTGSITSVLPVPNLGAYGASKAGVVSVSEALALELAHEGSSIGVSVLLPGYIGTKITSSGRNRPANLGDAATAPARPRTTAGVVPRMTTDEVAERSFEAIRADEFWILTHPDYEPVLHDRVDAMVNGGSPRPAPIW